MAESPPALPAGLVAELRARLPHTDLLANEPLSRHTSFRIGGPADLLLRPYTVADLQEIVRIVREKGLPRTVIGNGSNLLVRDGGLRGLVVKVAENLAEVEFRGDRCHASGGALLGAVSRQAAVRGLGGLEFAVGIPGTIGGGAMMNAGAYGGEMVSVVTHVCVVDQAGEHRKLPLEELAFAYRATRLQREPWIVTSVEMSLRPGEPERILAQMSRNNFLREAMQPLHYPSAGSVFKRPPGKFVGPMIQELGLKGYRIGGAQVSEKHAGFIVNRGGATAADVLTLIAQVREQVQARFGVWLELEIRVLGEEPEEVGPARRGE